METFNFKKGDRVRLKNDFFDQVAGQTAIVDRVYNGFVDVTFDNGTHHVGVFDWRFNKVALEKPKVGDRVRIVLEGTVIPKHDYRNPHCIKVRPEGSRGSNLIDTEAEGVTVEVTEAAPVYEVGTLVQDGNGEYFQRAATGGWLRMGHTARVYDDRMVTPLTIIEKGTAK